MSSGILTEQQQGDLMPEVFYPELQDEYNSSQIRDDPRNQSSNSYTSSNYDDNLIKWQLELDSILERIEHMLRGDKPTYRNGNILWMPPKNENERIMNEYGIAEIMRVLLNYVNRNTVLSNYREEVINTKMLDLGTDLTDLVFLKYDDFGLDTLQKRKLYPIIIRELVDICHSAYLRALHGGERESLREARQVTQMEHPMMPNINFNTGSQQKKGIINRILGRG